MKRLFSTMLLVALLASAAALQAQITHTTKGNVDKNAEKVLKLAAKKVNATPVSFTVTMINKNSKKRETARQTAQVLFNKGKYCVTLPKQVLYCNGASVWHWNKEVNEVTINNMTANDDDLMNPASLLNNYAKNYRAKYIRTDNDGTAIIDLTPKKAKSYYKIRILINSNTNIIKQLEIHNYDSSCGEYVVSNFKSGVAVSDANFTFSTSQHPKVEVIDMR